MVRSLPHGLWSETTVRGLEMSYILRFVQQYQPSAARKFFELETQFRDLELCSPHLPKGKRYQPLSGREPANTLVWECEFPSLAGIQKALETLIDDSAHTALFEKQLPYISKMRTEIYQVLDL